MSACPDIVLTQLQLWCDPTRIQTWPALLAAVPHDALVESPTHLGREHATGRMTSQRHSAAFDLVRNLPGLERRGSALQLRGVGFLERTAGGYRLSAEGQRLGGLYRIAPTDQAWVIALAEQLIGKEPRTRALMGLLSEPGAVLEFDGDAWFSGSPRRARVTTPIGNSVSPFVTDPEARTLGDILAERGWWCLGDWRSHELLEGAETCRLVGLNAARPSLHKVALALRAALEVFLAAGIVQSRRGKAWLDTPSAAKTLPERAVEFGWHSPAFGSLVDTLAAVLPELQSPTGHVVASELRLVLKSRGFDDPDRAIADAEHEGRVHIYSEEYGQSRHGRGLFGDPRKQLIKLRIIGTGATT